MRLVGRPAWWAGTTPKAAALEGSVVTCVFLPGAPLLLSVPWWESAIPRIVRTDSLQSAIDYHANIAFNAACSDPGWGL